MEKGFIVLPPQDIGLSPFLFFPAFSLSLLLIPPETAAAARSTVHAQRNVPVSAVGQLSSYHFNFSGVLDFIVREGHLEGLNWMVINRLILHFNSM